MRTQRTCPVRRFDPRCDVWPAKGQLFPIRGLVASMPHMGALRGAWSLLPWASSWPPSPALGAVSSSWLLRGFPLLPSYLGAINTPYKTNPPLPLLVWALNPQREEGQRALDPHASADRRRSQARPRAISGTAPCDLGRAQVSSGEIERELGVPNIPEAQGPARPCP